MLIAVGSYSQDLGFVAGKGKGVYAIRFPEDFDGATTEARVVVPSSVAANPSYLAATADALYVVDERNEISGRLHSFSRDFEPRGTVECVDTSTCFVAATPTHVLAANYAGASPRASVVSVRHDDGRLLSETRQVISFPKAAGPVVARQETSHAHMAFPVDGAVLVPDLGSDVVWSVEYSPDSGLIGEPSVACECPPGSGPRHCAASTNGAFLFVLCELSATLLVFAVDDGGRPASRTPAATVDVLPPAVDRGKAMCAALRVSRNAVYCSVRVDDAEGQICVARLDPRTGAPLDAPTTWVGTRGRTPRDIILLTPKTLLAANQDSDTIFAFDVDPDTGALTPTTLVCRAARTPVCLAPLLDMWS
ncbi:hypothetical protein CTAYLR_005070 [Chrysophaeum taylorii]|uniref:6-phosphogluconolactonase n=1 Tax=Chrysophaeum taylorii TaxID=2483200 RepID=A0AAD7UAR8_9STRA|nr:hypothetical protein CTAYLR_005070 [Chrysophaeum taylorii]